nr:hypothetical protein SPACI_52760 [Sporomusa acidovorans DSM 3132]
MAGNKIGFMNEIRRFDRFFPKPQMGNGYTAGLFGIIGKIGLGIHVGVIANDLNSIFVGAYGSI